MYTFKDKGQIGLDWAEEIPRADNKKPIICIVPGLTSNNDEIYIVNMIKEAIQGGFICVVINYRGGSDVPLTVSN